MKIVQCDVAPEHRGAFFFAFRDTLVAPYVIILSIVYYYFSFNKSITSDLNIAQKLAFGEVNHYNN